jgi:hypothetical protein
VASQDPRVEDEHVASVLRDARPVPDDRFVQQVEARLFEKRAARRQRRPLAAALGVSGALAAAFAAATLVGSGPLGSHDDKASAKPNCSDVRVTSPVRRGELVLDKQGRPHVVYRTRPVTRTVRRCHR